MITKTKFFNTRNSFKAPKKLDLEEEEKSGLDGEEISKE
jgi:hypothetical protein